MLSIYVPRQRGEATALLRRVGAAWALDKSVTAMSYDVREGGPDGGGGTLIYFDSRHGTAQAPITKIDGESQEWLPAAARGDEPGGRFWLGMWRKYRPAPEDLQRADVADGMGVELLDHRQWVVPLVDKLPKLLRLNRETGAQYTAPQAQYAAFTERTEALFQTLISKEFHDQLRETMTVTIPDGMNYAADALAVNYRIGLDLVDALGIVGDFEVLQIAAAATGLELMATAAEQNEVLTASSGN